VKIYKDSMPSLQLTDSSALFCSLFILSFKSWDLDTRQWSKWTHELKPSYFPWSMLAW